MNILTIIGNGFDLGHGLPTSFDAFIQSNPSVYPKKYATFRGGDGTWTRVEWDYGKQLCKILAERSWHDVTEVVEQIISDYGLNEYGEVDYFGFSSDAFEDEYQAIHFRVDLLSDFEKDFQQYLLANCGDAVLGKIVTYNNIRHILNASSRIISFNYTSTIETAYGVTNVDHIHGSVDTSIAIGSGALDEAKESLVDDEYPTIDKFGRDKYGLQELAGYYDYDDEGNRYPKGFIERFFKEVAASATEREAEVFNLLDVKNKDALTSRISTIASLGEEHYDMVYIIGHALGVADYSVFDAINKDAEVICYYYSEAKKAEMENTLKNWVSGIQWFQTQKSSGEISYVDSSGKQCICNTNAKSHPFRFHGTDGFLLVEALPQAPINAVFQTAAARFWESLFLLSTLSKIVFPCFPLINGL